MIATPHSTWLAAHAQRGLSGDHARKGGDGELLPARPSRTGGRGLPDRRLRQRGVFGVDGRPSPRRGMVRPRRLVGLLRLARAEAVLAGPVGSDTGRTRCALTAQRFPAPVMALRGPWSATLAHGRSNRAAAASVRQVFAGLPRLDRSGQTPGSARLPRAHGGCGQSLGQPLAGNPHDARDCRCRNVSLCQRRRNDTRTERVAL